MAREWTRKSIEEIMRAVIAREGGGGSVDWVTELAKSFQNENIDTSSPHWYYGKNGVSFVYTIEMPSEPPPYYTPDGGGLYAGKFLQGNLTTPVAFDEMYLVLPPIWGSGYNPQWFSVGTIINCFFELNAITLGFGATPLSRVYFPTYASALMTEKTITSTDGNVTAKFSVAGAPVQMFQGVNDSNEVMTQLNNFAYGIKVEITQVNSMDNFKEPTFILTN